ncbi:hypothetical protein Naga_100957g2 [Nannochloropsis gaditana]|uniref:Uncharacterized protein n=1 Tax=Nannochloropsis gaditana TaxID=72520 RepID=W7TRG0_9STRA|nr:hypothetical protein Naga_100957g2 [Nannochloropsis gaditana]
MRRADGKKSPQRKKRIGRAEGGLYIDIRAVGRGGRGGEREGGREGGRCDPVVSARARWRVPGGEEELWHARWGGRGDTGPARMMECTTLPQTGPNLPSGSSLLLTPWSSCARQEVDEGGRGGAEGGRQRRKSSFESRSGRVKELAPFFIFPRRGIAVAYFYKREDDRDRNMKQFDSLSIARDVA